MVRCVRLLLQLMLFQCPVHPLMTAVYYKCVGISRRAQEIKRRRSFFIGDFFRLDSHLVIFLFQAQEFPYSNILSLLSRRHEQQLAARRVVSLAASRRAVALSATTRSYGQMVPRAGSDKAMLDDSVEQIRARVLAQTEIEKLNHHSYAEEVDEMWKWVKISLMVMLPLCALSSVKDILFGEDHSAHHADGPLPDYMHIRNKEFPWECGDCDLFDMDCWKKCKAEKAAES